MKHINPNTVTHIKIYKLTRGVYTKYYGLQDYHHLPEKKSPFLSFSESRDECYFNNILDDTITMSELESRNNIFPNDGVLYSKPHIEIYCGDTLIHTEYFPSDIDMENHISSNYTYLNIKYT